jgi:hypothetical protein
MVRIAWVLCGVLVIAVYACAAGKEPTEQDVQQAVQRGIDFLWSQQRSDGSWPAYGDPTQKENYNYQPTGPGAMAVYALLANGVDAGDPRMKRALDWLANRDANRTYSVAARCCAWLMANERMKGRYLDRLRREGLLLVRGNRPDGGYNYFALRDAPGNPGGMARTDNSCSQFGVLGVWSAVEGGVAVPKDYWERVLRHWLDTQNADGGWGYQKSNSSTSTMTAAGVVTLFLCQDKLFLADYVECKRAKPLPALEKGLEWLNRNFQRSLQSSQERQEYFLYGVERVGLAGGYKYFGTIDWYLLGRKLLLDRQQENGSWKRDDAIADTAFALLFLARGRQPVLVNKLEFPGDWNNRPRELASLTRWLSHQFESTAHWQITNLRVPVEELHDAPILFLSGARQIDLDSEDIAKLRAFVLQGGYLLSLTANRWPAFEKGIRRIYQEVFPEYPLVALEENHPIYSCMYKNFQGRPKLYMMSNGVRPLAVHIEDDLAKSWQLNAWKNKPRDYEIAANIVRYVVGGVKDLPPRGVSHWPQPPEEPVSRAVGLVRLRYKGNWDPEPMAYVRFAAQLARDEALRLDIEMLDVRDIAKAQARVASLTGTSPLALDEKQVAALKAWLAAGGTLLVDAAGGNREFAASAQALLKKMFSDLTPSPLAKDVGLFTLKDHAVTEFRFRRAIRSEGKTESKRRWGLRAMAVPPAQAQGPVGGVLFSAEDITAGLLGYPSGVVDGYHPANAYAIVRNLLLTAGDVKDLTPPVSTAPAPGRPRAR